MLYIFPPTPLYQRKWESDFSGHVHQLISLKLDNNNYLLWRSQFLPILRGYDSEGYIDELIVLPLLLMLKNIQLIVPGISNIESFLGGS